MSRKVFRFDDVCINCDMEHTNALAMYLRGKYDAEIWYAISPLVRRIAGEGMIDKQRVFPRIWNAHSDHKIFYGLDECGVPSPVPDFIKRCSHGLLHVDHRLLNKQAQEISILTATSLIGSRVFVPPFNKWNADTESICSQYDIELIKFEDGWRCLEYEPFNDDYDLWYLHAREFANLPELEVVL